jgi:hypothetical protein
MKFNICYRFLARPMAQSLIICLLTLFFFFNWLPQFYPRTFEDKPVITGAMPQSGHDLAAVVFSAQRWKDGLSPRLTIAENDPGAALYDKVIHGYGSLAILAGLPLTPLNFQKVRILWLISSLTIFVSVAFLLWREDLARRKLPDFEFFVFASVLIFFSGPLGLLLERGNIEIVVPLLLSVLWFEFRRDKVSWLSAVSLGIAMHLKIWPIAFLPLLLTRTNLRHLVSACVICLLITLSLERLSSIQEWMTTVQIYGKETSVYVGGKNVSLNSLLQIWGAKPNWRALSAAVLLLSGLVIVIRQNLYSKPLSPKDRDGLFGLAIIAGLLAPACVWDYCLVSTIFLLPAANSPRLKWTGALCVAFAMNNYWFHGAKPLALVVLFLHITYEIYSRRSEKTVLDHGMT